MKKILSLLITINLIVGIANIPVYAGASAISATKTTDAVLLQPYYTPAQLAKQVVAKPKATATKTTKAKAKAKATKKVSLTTQIINKYTKKGLQALQAFAKKLGFTLKAVYNQFVKYGVTKDQMKKVASGLLNMVNRGADFCVCSTLAVARYLGISQSLAAVQQVAAEISLNFFDPKDKSHYIATTWDAQAKVLSKNRVKNSECYYIKKEDLINLKKGTKILVNAYCYNKKNKWVNNHAITVVRQKDGNYAVYDILVNNGNKVLYTKNQFKRLIAGKSAQGKTSSGSKITKSVYLDSAEGYLRYKFVENGETYIVGNSNKVPSSSARNIYNKAITTINKLLKNKDINNLVKKWLKKEKTLVNKIINSNKTNLNKEILINEKISLLDNYKRTIALVNKLLKKKGLNALAKKWLNKAKNLINNTMGNNKSNSAKYEWLNKAYSGLWLILNQKTTLISFYKQTVSGIFSSLKNVFKNDLTYKIYAKYGEVGVDSIKTLSNYLGISQDTIYKTFVKNKVGNLDTLNGVFVYLINTGSDIFKLKTGDQGLNDALAELKELSGK